MSGELPKTSKLHEVTFVLWRMERVLSWDLQPITTLRNDLWGRLLPAQFTNTLARLRGTCRSMHSRFVRNSSVFRSSI